MSKIQHTSISATEQFFTSTPYYKPNSNWAFIDIQNLYKAVLFDGWKLDLKKFREYLAVELNVIRAIFFMGYIHRNEWLYNKIRKAGFEIEFRNVTVLPNGSIEGGNVDADLASFIMDNKLAFYKAIVVADDADYTRMIQSLVKQNKLGMVISSHIMKRTSKLIKSEVPRNMIMSIHSVRTIVESKGKNSN